MALTTYSELQDSIASWLHRTDLTAKIPDFIALAESKINRKLRLAIMESDESVSLTAATRTIALPTRYLEPISLDLVISGQEYDRLTYVMPTQLSVMPSVSSRPRYWTINGGNIEFGNVADQTYSMQFRMLKGFSISTTTTNDLLTNYPDVYLYGTLLQAAPYLAQDARASTWKAFYDDAIKEINAKEARTKVLAGSRSELASNRTTNIISG